MKLEDVIGDEAENFREQYEELCAMNTTKYTDGYQRNERCGWWKHVWETFDHKVLFAIMMNSFSRGGRTVAVLSLITLFKNEPYRLSASER